MSDGNELDFAAFDERCDVIKSELNHDWLLLVFLGVLVGDLSFGFLLESFLLLLLSLSLVFQ